jgi:Mn2+/Fe2+ NRAMP family transporter
MAFEIEQPNDLDGQSAVVEPTKPRLLGVLGPGLITGASDDDPSGIATYSQAGAQFGYALTWTMLTAIVTMLLIANAINIGADLGAMADASRLVLGGPQILYVLLFAAICIALKIFLQYSRYVSVLKWLTLFLFAYVATLFMVKLPWTEALKSLVVPPYIGTRIT